MVLEFLVWLFFLLIACAGSVAQTVAISVGELHPTILAAQGACLRRYRLAGTVLSILGMALVAAWCVFVLAAHEPGSFLTAFEIGVAVLIALLAQAIASALAAANMERLARPILGDAAVFLPLIEPRDESAEPEEVKEDAVEQIVQAGEKAGLIESGEHEMISGIIHLDTTAAREIMVPRMDVVGVDAESTLRAALDVIIAGAHSRLPVYEESLDHVVGLLYAKDLLKAMRDGKMEAPLRSLLRPAHFVPESQPLDTLLQELQASKVHMAIVVDEYGGTAGIVTIEDVLEEIVGEIQDEYDTGEEPLIERISANEGVFNARVNIDDVNESLSVNLPDESDTLGGLVYGRLQKMAKVGDQVQVDGVTISVLSVTGRRIKKVRVSKHVAGPPLPVENKEQAAQT